MKRRYITSEADENVVNELQIRVEGEDGQNIVFQLNNSPAANTLYALGEAVSGTDQIETLSGEIRLEAVDNE